MSVYTWFTAIANSVVYSVLAPLSEVTDLTVGNLNAGTGYQLDPRLPELLHLGRVRLASAERGVPRDDVEAEADPGEVPGEVLNADEEACRDGDYSLTGSTLRRCHCPDTDRRD